MSLTTCGEWERLKLAVHAVMLVGAAVCCVYNACAFLQRRARHSWVNAVTYGALVVLESVHVEHHWRD